MACLGDGNLRRLALDNFEALATHGRRRIQDYDMADYEQVEKVSQGGEMKLFGRWGVVQSVYVLTHVAGNDANELNPMLPAPSQESRDGKLIVPACVDVSELA